MPGNFPDVWLNRVIHNLNTSDSAPWLEGVPELDVDVAQMNEGSAGETNVISIPTSLVEPEVLINNSSYPIDVVAYADGTITISLDKYQTKATSVTDDQIIGASYNKIDAATRNHTTAILKKKFSKAIHALAPATDAADTPVIETTGTASTGVRKPLVYADLVALKAKFDLMECPEDGRRLVLSSEHLNDLLLDRANFGNLMINYQAGKPLGMIAGFEIYSYVSNPYFAAADGSKIAYGTAAGANDFRASVAFYAPNVAKKTGLTKQYFQRASEDPQNQQNLLNYRHYFITVPMRAKYIGAIMSKKA